MRLSRTELIPVLTIMAGGAIGALVTFSPLVLWLPSNEVPALVRPVPVPSPPRVFEECDDNHPYRLLNSGDMDRRRVEWSPDGRPLAVIQCDEDRQRDFDREPDLSAGPVFTPMTVRPEIRNRSEVQAALMREYPRILRDHGIGGTVVVWFLVSEQGTVLERRVSESSGRIQLDEAALRVADAFTFTPAMNRNEVVPVWILLPINFQVRTLQVR